MTDKAPIVGIDLGTYKCRIAAWKDEKLQIIPDPRTKNNFIPSYVTFTGNKEIYIGERAKKALSKNPRNTLFDVKHLIGAAKGDLIPVRNRYHWPFRVSHSSGRAMVEVDRDERKEYSPVLIMSFLLKQMLQNANDFLGLEVTHAVMTVPSFYNEYQRQQATKDVADIAKVSLIHVIDDCFAAALAYCFEKELTDVDHMLVYDLGMYSFQVSVLKVKDGYPEVVVCESDNSTMGSRKLDLCLVKHCVKKNLQEPQPGLNNDVEAPWKLLPACEEAKATLSCVTHTNVKTSDHWPDCNFICEISRQQFEDMCTDVINETLNLVECALRKAEIDKGKIEHVVLVGGSTRIPKLREMVKNFFNLEELDQSIDPEELVVNGAALAGVFLSRNLQEGSAGQVCWSLKNMETEAGLSSGDNGAVRDETNQNETSQDENHGESNEGERPGEGGDANNDGAPDQIGESASNNYLEGVSQDGTETGDKNEKNIDNSVSWDTTEDWNVQCVFRAVPAQVESDGEGTLPLQTETEAGIHSYGPHNAPEDVTSHAMTRQDGNNKDCNNQEDLQGADDNKDVASDQTGDIATNSSEKESQDVKPCLESETDVGTTDNNGLGIIENADVKDSCQTKDSGTECEAVEGCPMPIHDETEAGQGNESEDVRSEAVKQEENIKDGNNDVEILATANNVNDGDFDHNGDSTNNNMEGGLTDSFVIVPGSNEDTCTSGGRTSVDMDEKGDSQTKDDASSGQRAIAEDNSQENNLDTSKSQSEINEVVVADSNILNNVTNTGNEEYSKNKTDQENEVTSFRSAREHSIESRSDWVSFTVRYNGINMQISKNKFAFLDNIDVTCSSILEGKRVSIITSLQGWLPEKKASDCPEIEVIFGVDANGIIDVSDIAVKFTQRHTIFTDETYKLRQKMMEMRQELYGFREKEKTKRDREVAETNLEKYLYEVKQTVEDSNKVPENTKDRVTSECYELLEFIEENEEEDAIVYEQKLATCKKKWEGLMNKLRK